LRLARRHKNHQSAPTAATKQLELPYDQHITLSELEAHLWESAKILRGPVDVADFKIYIFPLLFFKRMMEFYHQVTAMT
jgi:type I restriction-modification system DNA methylase subunit